MMYFGWFWMVVPLLIIVAVVIATRSRSDSGNGPPAPANGTDSQWLWVVAVAVVVVLVGGLLWAGTAPGWMWGHMGWSQTSQASGDSQAPFSDAETVQVIADDLSFNPSTLALSADEPVNILVTNQGRVFHDFTIPDLDFTMAVNPGDTVEAGLGPVPPGAYEFLCTVPGHAEAGMRGTVTVS